MREQDWAISSLGASVLWPQSLCSVVNLMLGSAFPMFVAWGPTLSLLYNDAYAEVLGAKHPQALGRPFVAPPGVPADRLAALRKAFMDTMKDPEFIAEADKAKLEVTPIDGEKVQQIVVEAYKVDPAIAKKTEEMLKVENK